MKAEQRRVRTRPKSARLFLLCTSMGEWKTYNEMTAGEKLMFRLYGKYSCTSRYNKEKKAVEYKMSTFDKKYK